MSKQLSQNPAMPRAAVSELFKAVAGTNRDYLVRIIEAMKTYLRGRFARSRREYEMNHAIEHLRRLTDAQLRDLGITRADIVEVVRNGKP